MTETVLGTLVLAIWIAMIVGRSGFWLARERDVPGSGDPDDWPHDWPPVTAIVPARDEGDGIGQAISSLIAQDYPGKFNIVLVDDGSTDETVARARAAAVGSARLTVLTGARLMSGWTGKLWAVSQGVIAAGSTPDYLLLTDADIVHAPDTVRSLVARAVSDDRVLVSLMARLRCESLAERALIPAFVFFFQLLYPFAEVNRRGSGRGGAAGGVMLVERRALERAGGIAAVRGALIDDCAFGALLKRQGAIWLGLTDRAVSIRRYDTVESVAAMISRSAYAQLGYSPILLVGTIMGLGLTYLAPPLLAVFGNGYAQGLGWAAWALMTIAFQPILRFYRRSPIWGTALPLIACFYAGCTVLSAWQHWQGRGGMWKGRMQAGIGRP